MILRKKNQDELQGNHTTRELHAKKLAQDPNPGHLQTQSGRSCGQYLLNDRWFSHSVLKDVASEMANYRNLTLDSGYQTFMSFMSTLQLT